MKSLARLGLWVAVALAPTIGAGQACADDGGSNSGAVAPASSQAAQPAEPPGQPPAAPAEQYAEPTVATDANGDPGSDAEAGPSTALGIAGIAVGVAGIVAGAALLFAGADQKGEAKELSQTIQSQMPGSNQCGGPQPHARCDDLASAADKGVVMETAGYLLLVGGGVLALSGGLYLGVGGGGQAATEVSIQIAPQLGPGVWGATAGGTF